MKISKTLISWHNQIYQTPALDWSVCSISSLSVVLSGLWSMLMFTSHKLSRPTSSCAFNILWVLLKGWQNSNKWTHCPWRMQQNRNQMNIVISKLTQSKNIIKLFLQNLLYLFFISLRQFKFFSPRFLLFSNNDIAFYYLVPLLNI